MKEKTIINFIAHTHWDREWYFTINDAALLSTWNFEKIVDTLENNPNFPSFLLDGQTSIIEDAIELKPELKNRISKLVKERRIFIGPWYTQTDSFYVDGESFIRNLYFGTMFAKEFGHSMQLGYLPDTFGHNVQTPQLYKGFGLNTALFWRGRNKKEIFDTYFNWRGIDGSEVLTLNLIQGYSLASGIKNDKQEWDEKIIPLINKLDNDTKFKNIIMPSGGDQVLIDPKLPNTIKKLGDYLGDGYETKITNYEDFIVALRNEIGDISKLQIWENELRFPEVARIHRTIGSSRYDLKKLSFILEHKLINILEPLTIFIKKKINPFLINKEVEKISWKLLLSGHSHDSLGACNTDITNENVLNRFKKAENLVDGLINLFKKIIGKNIYRIYNTDLVLYNFDIVQKENICQEIVLFSNTKNIEVYDGDEKVEFTKTNIEKIGINGARKVILTSKGDVEKKIPPYYKITGYITTTIKPFGIKVLKTREVEKSVLISSTKNDSIENSKLKLTIQNSEINILDKKNQRLYKKFISLENMANDGDSYDYSPIKNDIPIETIEITKLETKSLSDDIKEIKFKATMKVPLKLIERRKRSEKLVSQDFEFVIHLIENKLRINIKTINLAKDHRFRLKFNTSKHNLNKIVTDVQFGFLERKFIPIPTDWKEWMVERPDNYYPIINTFYTKNENSTIVVNTKGMKEIEIKENNDIYLILYKSDGWLGKNDLELRPNRASGINNVLVPTPDAQLYLRNLEFDLEISFNNKDINENNITDIKNNFITKFDYYQNQNIDVFKDRLERFQLPINDYNIEKDFTLFNFGKELKLVSSYISYKDNSTILRFLNINEIEVNISEYFKNHNIEFINFAEEQIEVEDTLPKYRLITVKLK